MIPPGKLIGPAPGGPQKSTVAHVSPASPDASTTVDCVDVSPIPLTTTDDALVRSTCQIVSRPANSARSDHVRPPSSVRYRWFANPSAQCSASVALNALDGGAFGADPCTSLTSRGPVRRLQVAPPSVLTPKKGVSAVPVPDLPYTTITSPFASTGVSGAYSGACGTGIATSRHVVPPSVVCARFGSRRPSAQPSSGFVNFNAPPPSRAFRVSSFQVPPPS